MRHERFLAAWLLLCLLARMMINLRGNPSKRYSPPIIISSSISISINISSSALAKQRNAWLFVTSTGPQAFRLHVVFSEVAKPNHQTRHSSGAKSLPSFVRFTTSLITAL
ncbi:hypothetical protein ACLKA6_008192 [Drosophila palustris]